jgi:hypothetical protein
MGFKQRFSRRPRTSRRYVFENIMDLDHVCVFHRGWFEKLRIRSWRTDDVDDKLSSRFYGLKQDIDVRGAPIDEDRYWYEFNGPLARIRVEGEMDGPDGNLTLTETVTFRCPWPLTPFLWLLAPLFKRQKLDILKDDASLPRRLHPAHDVGRISRDEGAHHSCCASGDGGWDGPGGRLGFKGIADLRRWISFDRLISELSRRGVAVATHQDTWERLADPTI